MKNLSKKTAKALAVSMFAVGFVTPLMFSNIAEAENFGAGGTVQWLSNDVLSKTDATKWATSSTRASSITNDNCVMLDGYRFKIVAVQGTGSSAKVTLWSYDKVKHGTETGFGTAKYVSSGSKWGTWTSGDEAAKQAAINKAYAAGDLAATVDGLISKFSTETQGRIQTVTLADETNINSSGYGCDYKTANGSADLTAKVWLPSWTEVKGDTGSGGSEAAGTWGLTADDQRDIGNGSWLRSPNPVYGSNAYFVGSSGYVDNYYLVGYVSLLRPALQILNQTSAVFTTNVAIPTDGVFTADGDKQINYAPYALNSSATATFDPTGSGVTLDGTKIGITASTSDATNYKVAGLLTKATSGTDTWANLNGTTANIAYMAQASSGTLDLSGVTDTDDYTLKIFGLKTADTTVTELASGAINGLSKGTDGKIHMQVSGSVNAGVPVTVSNGAVVDFGGGDLTAKLDLKSGGNLAVNGQLNFGTNGVVEQAAGSNVTVDASKIEATSNDPAKAMFTGVNDASKLDVSAGNLSLKGMVYENKYYVLAEGTAVDASFAENNLWKRDNIKFPGVLLAEYETDISGNSAALKVTKVATFEEVNTSGLAAVQQGAMSMGNEIASSIVDNLGVMSRPALSVGSRAKIRNVASTVEDKYNIETVEQGNANEVMPVQVVEKDEYDKEVWASYIRTKETTEGMNLGAGLKGNNTAQYNGTVVGVDFYSSKKAIAGMALSYTTGDIDSFSGTTSTRNKSKYYGISFYDRVTNGNTALIYDIGYIRGNNDISQFNNAKETTADVKTNNYTAGARWEAEIETGKSKIVPFAAFRYMRQNNGDYTNSHGTKFDTKNQNIYIPKVGIAWTGDFIMPKSVWTWRPSVEAGYVWNLGDRTADSNVLMGTRPAAIEYDTVDKSSYYAKLGMEFMCKNFTAGLFYRYLKGSAVRNNKWNVNVAWSF